MPLLEEAIAMAKKRTIRELENSGRIGKEEAQEHIALEFTHFFDKLTVNSKTPYEPFPKMEKLHEIGHTNYVYWDGKCYECKTEFLEDATDLQFRGIGNVARFRGEGDTGEPFLIRLAVPKVFDPNVPVSYSWRVYCYDDFPAAHTFKLVDEVTVITIPISDEYLPGPVVIDLPIDKDTLFSGNNIPVDYQMVETLEKAATNHSTVYVRITDGSTVVFPFNLSAVQSGQDYKYYTFTCVSLDLKTASYSGFMINLHTGDKTINGKATSIKGIFA